LEVLAWHLPGGTEEDHAKVRIVIFPDEIQSEPLLNTVLSGRCLYMFH